MNALLAHFNVLEEAWRAPESTLMAILNDRRACVSVIKMRQTIDLDADLITLRKIGARAVTIIDEDYPPLLRQIYMPPPLIYVKGDLRAVDNRAMAIVGTRDATAYGLKVARGLAHALVGAGWTIVSGLAKGIDAAAHSAALHYGGRTFALLGHGIDQVYPADHAALATQISKQGALITEYPLGTPPEGRNFPARNRLISGLSRGVVVVEASLKSGALSTAYHAVDQGREAFAVPGSIQSPESAGTHSLIQKGHAKLITSIADLWAELQPGLLEVPQVLNDSFEADTKPKRKTVVRNGTKPILKDGQSTTTKHLSGRNADTLFELGELSSVPTRTEADLRELEGLDEQSIAVWRCLRTEPLRIDDLCVLSGLTVAQVSTALTLLEIHDLIRQNGGLIYAISELE